MLYFTVYAVISMLMDKVVRFTAFRGKNKRSCEFCNLAKNLPSYTWYVLLWPRDYV